MSRLRIIEKRRWNRVNQSNKPLYHTWTSQPEEDLREGEVEEVVERTEQVWGQLKMPNYAMQGGQQQQQQGQLICSGCRTLLVYPQGASNVRCALCSSVTQVPPQGTEMSQLICGGCRTLLMYMRGATSVQCSCCHTVNLAMEGPQFAHINCGGCGMTLMYQYGAQSVKCALCQYVTSIVMPNMRVPLPAQQRPPTATAPQGPPPLPSGPHSHPQAAGVENRGETVVVENPMTLDESGKLVSNVAVGVSTDRR